jgi:hypothetical protein
VCAGTAAAAGADLPLSIDDCVGVACLLITFPPAVGVCLLAVGVAALRVGVAAAAAPDDDCVDVRDGLPNVLTCCCEAADDGMVAVVCVVLARGVGALDVDACVGVCVGVEALTSARAGVAALVVAAVVGVRAAAAALAVGVDRELRAPAVGVDAVVAGMDPVDARTLPCVGVAALTVLVAPGADCRLGVGCLFVCNGVVAGLAAGDGDRLDDGVVVAMVGVDVACGALLVGAAGEGARFDGVAVVGACVAVVCAGLFVGAAGEGARFEGVGAFADDGVDAVCGCDCAGVNGGLTIAPPPAPDGDGARLLDGICVGTIAFGVVGGCGDGCVAVAVAAADLDGVVALAGGVFWELLWDLGVLGALVEAAAAAELAVGCVSRLITGDLGFRITLLLALLAAGDGSVGALAVGVEGVTVAFEDCVALAVGFSAA